MKINTGKLMGQFCNLSMLSAVVYFSWQFMRVGAYMLTLPMIAIGLAIIFNMIIVGRI